MYITYDVGPTCTTGIVGRRTVARGGRGENDFKPQRIFRSFQRRAGERWHPKSPFRYRDVFEYLYIGTGRSK